MRIRHHGSPSPSSSPSHSPDHEQPSLRAQERVNGVASNASNSQHLAQGFLPEVTNVGREEGERIRQFLRAIDRDRMGHRQTKRDMFDSTLLSGNPWQREELAMRGKPVGVPATTDVFAPDQLETLSRSSSLSTQQRDNTPSQQSLLNLLHAVGQGGSSSSISQRHRSGSSMPASTEEEEERRRQRLSGAAAERPFTQTPLSAITLDIQDGAFAPTSPLRRPLPHTKTHAGEGEAGSSSCSLGSVEDEGYEARQLEGRHGDTAHTSEDGNGHAAEEAASTNHSNRSNGQPTAALSGAGTTTRHGIIDSGTPSSSSSHTQQQTEKKEGEGRYSTAADDDERPPSRSNTNTPFTGSPQRADRDEGRDEASRRTSEFLETSSASNTAGPSRADRRASHQKKEKERERLAEEHTGSDTKKPKPATASSSPATATTDSNTRGGSSKPTAEGGGAASISGDHGGGGKAHGHHRHRKRFPSSGGPLDDSEESRRHSNGGVDHVATPPSSGATGAKRPSGRLSSSSSSPPGGGVEAGAGGQRRGAPGGKDVQSRRSSGSPDTSLAETQRPGERSGQKSRTTSEKAGDLSSGSLFDIANTGGGVSRKHSASAAAAGRNGQPSNSRQRPGGRAGSSPPTGTENSRSRQAPSSSSSSTSPSSKRHAPLGAEAGLSQDLGSEVAWRSQSPPRTTDPAQRRRSGAGQGGRGAASTPTRAGADPSGTLKGAGGVTRSSDSAGSLSSIALGATRAAAEGKRKGGPSPAASASALPGGRQGRRRSSSVVKSTETEEVFAPRRRGSRTSIGGSPEAGGSASLCKRRADPVQNQTAAGGSSSPDTKAKSPSGQQRRGASGTHGSRSGGGGGGGAPAAEGTAQRRPSSSTSSILPPSRVKSTTKKGKPPPGRDSLTGTRETAAAAAVAGGGRRLHSPSRTSPKNHHKAGKYTPATSAPPPTADEGSAKESKGGVRRGHGTPLGMDIPGLEGSLETNNSGDGDLKGTPGLLLWSSQGHPGAALPHSASLEGRGSAAAPTRAPGGGYHLPSSKASSGELRNRTRSSQEESHRKGSAEEARRRARTSSEGQRQRDGEDGGRDGRGPRDGPTRASTREGRGAAAHRCGSETRAGGEKERKEHRDAHDESHGGGSRTRDKWEEEEEEEEESSGGGGRSPSGCRRPLSRGQHLHRRRSSASSGYKEGGTADADPSRSSGGGAVPQRRRVHSSDRPHHRLGPTSRRGSGGTPSPSPSSSSSAEMGSSYTSRSRSGSTGGRRHRRHRSSRRRERHRRRKRWSHRHGCRRGKKKERSGGGASRPGWEELEQWKRDTEGRIRQDLAQRAALEAIRRDIEALTDQVGVLHANRLPLMGSGVLGDENVLLYPMDPTALQQEQPSPPPPLVPPLHFPVPVLAAAEEEGRSAALLLPRDPLEALREEIAALTREVSTHLLDQETSSSSSSRSSHRAASIHPVLSGYAAEERAMIRAAKRDAFGAANDTSTSIISVLRGVLEAMGGTQSPPPPQVEKEREGMSAVCGLSAQDSPRTAGATGGCGMGGWNNLKPYAAQLREALAQLREELQVAQEKGRETWARIEQQLIEDERQHQKRLLELREKAQQQYQAQKAAKAAAAHRKKQVANEKQKQQRRQHAAARQDDVASRVALGNDILPPLRQPRRPSMAATEEDKRRVGGQRSPSPRDAAAQDQNQTQRQPSLQEELAATAAAAAAEGDAQLVEDLLLLQDALMERGGEAAASSAQSEVVRADAMPQAAANAEARVWKEVQSVAAAKKGKEPLRREHRGRDTAARPGVSSSKPEGTQKQRQEGLRAHRRERSDAEPNFLLSRQDFMGDNTPPSQRRRQHGPLPPLLPGSDRPGGRWQLQDPTLCSSARRRGNTAPDGTWIARPRHLAPVPNSGRFPEPTQQQGLGGAAVGLWVSEPVENAAAAPLPAGSTPAEPPSPAPPATPLSVFSTPKDDSSDGADKHSRPVPLDPLHNTEESPLADRVAAPSLASGVSWNPPQEVCQGASQQEALRPKSNRQQYVVDSTTGHGPMKPLSQQSSRAEPTGLRRGQTVSILNSGEYSITPGTYSEYGRQDSMPFGSATSLSRQPSQPEMAALRHGQSVSVMGSQASNGTPAAFSACGRQESVASEQPYHRLPSVQPEPVVLEASPSVPSAAAASPLQESVYASQQEDPRPSPSPMPQQQELETLQREWRHARARWQQTKQQLQQHEARHPQYARRVGLRCQRRVLQDQLDKVYKRRKRLAGREEKERMTAVERVTEAYKRLQKEERRQSKELRLGAFVSPTARDEAAQQLSATRASLMAVENELEEAKKVLTAHRRMLAQARQVDQHPSRRRPSDGGTPATIAKVDREAQTLQRQLQDVEDGLEHIDAEMGAMSPASIAAQDPQQESFAVMRAHLQQKECQEQMRVRELEEAIRSICRMRGLDPNPFLIPLTGNGFGDINNGDASSSSSYFAYYGVPPPTPPSDDATSTVATTVRAPPVWAGGESAAPQPQQQGQITRPSPSPSPTRPGGEIGRPPLYPRGSSAAGPLEAGGVPDTNVIWVFPQQKPSDTEEDEDEDERLPLSVVAALPPPTLEALRSGARPTNGRMGSPGLPETTWIGAPASTQDSSGSSGML